MKGYIWLCTHYAHLTGDQALRDEPPEEIPGKHFASTSLPDCTHGTHTRERLPIDTDLICLPRTTSPQPCADCENVPIGTEIRCPIQGCDEPVQITSTGFELDSYACRSGHSFNLGACNCAREGVCPTCKEAIGENYDTCPVCGRDGLQEAWNPA